MVILTALPLEYRAIRDHLTGLRRRSHPEGTIFETGQLPGASGEVTIAMTGKGNGEAGVLTERAIRMFGPRALMFAGIAGAIKDDINLGDIVVATKVYAYSGAKAESDGMLLRPRGWDAPHELLQRAKHLDVSESWQRYLGADRTGRLPVLHFGPIAAGEVLLNSRDTPLARQLHTSYNDAVAIEMESAGVAQAGHLNRSLPVLTVRGISDKADGNKHAADQAGSQPIAAAHAAAFAIALAVDLAAEAGQHDPDAGQHNPDAGLHDAQAGQPDSRPVNTMNVQANGGTNFIVQNGHIHQHAHDG